MSEGFSARIEEANGKKTLVVKGRSETIIYPDGRQDVKIHAPALSIISKCAKEQGADNYRVEI